MNFPDFIEMGVDILNPVQVSAAGMDTKELKREFAFFSISGRLPLRCH